MSNTVWVSTVLTHSANMMPMRNDKFYHQDDADLFDSPKAGHDDFERNLRGESLDASHFATKIWCAPDYRTSKKLNDAFVAWGFLVVSARCADVLRGCDMGGGHLYPLQLLKKDRLTPMGGEWFCVNFGNQKSGVLLERSIPAVWENPYRKGIWQFNFGFKDDQMVVTKVFQTGPDLWVDPALKNAVFASDKLALALHAAKLHKPFGFKRCVVV